MGFQNRFKWPRLALERASPSLPDVLSKDDSISSEASKSTSQIWNNCPSQINQIPRPFVSGTKKSLGRDENYFGPFRTKPVHTMSKVSYDINHRHPEFSTSGSLYFVHRYSRRLFKRPHTSFPLSVPGPHSKQKEIYFHSDAERSQCGPQSLYQADECCHSIPETEEYQHHSLPGRSATMVQFSRNMCRTYLPSNTRTREEGIPHQLQEKPLAPQPKVRTSGPEMEYSVRNTVSPIQTSQINDSKHTESNSQRVDHFEGVPGCSWQNKLCHPGRPTKQMLGQRMVPLPEILSEYQEIHSRFTSSQPETLVEEPKSQASHFITGPNAFSGNLLRCLPIGMGIPHILGSSKQRNLVFSISESSYKLKRTNSGIFCTEGDPVTEAYPCTHKFGQHHSSLHSETSRFVKILAFKQLGTFHTETGPKEANSYLGSSHTWPTKRSSRCSIKNDTCSNRMDAGPSQLPISLECSPRSRSRPICDPGEQSNREIRISISRSTLDRYERSDSRLEQVGANIHFSADSGQTDSRDFEEAEDISGSSPASPSSLASSTLVSAVENTLHVRQPERSHSLPSSSRQDLYMQFFSCTKPSGLALLRKHYEEKYGVEIADIMINDTRKSTLRQYDSIFRLFATYVKNSGDSEVTEKTFFGFFLNCHQNLHRRATTLYSYRSALKRIATNVFNIDLYTAHFESFLKGLRLKEPFKPTPHISWSLNIVLEKLLTINKDSDHKAFIAKCAFLLQLAMGCRISELASVSRDPMYTKFLPGGQVNIIPDPKLLEKHTGSQLKKHERPDKVDGPLIIHPLFLNDGLTPSSICPVKNLKEYIARFPSKDQSQQLFVHHLTRNPCTIAQIRTSVTSIIKTACPGSFPKSHDVRKAAASVSLMSNMEFHDIASKTGWSQPKTFWSHYNVPIKRLKTRCISLGSMTKSMYH